jgi:hypothetical protein
MAKIIPIKIRKNTEQYQKILRALEDVEMKLLQIKEIEAKFRQQRQKLKTERDRLEDVILADIKKGEEND